MANKLTLYKEYSREEVHDIFSPESKFTKSTGTWGLQGIVNISATNDYVFFVTYGQSQSGHEFIEGIDENGFLEWQSQPQQDFESKHITNFINHDENINDIHLFLRSNKLSKYKYMGLLKYIDHNPEKVKPVYFKWLLLNFNDVEVKSIGIKPSIRPKNIISPVEKNKLQFSDKPIKLKIGKQSEDLLKAGFVDFEDLYDKNNELGKLGEYLVVEHEKNNLISLGRKDLADQVSATRDTIGNTAKYDVKSYFEDGRVKYIEVKTTKADISNPFYISESEVKFSEKYSENYFIYRVYEYDLILNSGKIFILKGSINRENLTSTNYYYNYF
jgi:hypothetical protein